MALWNNEAAIMLLPGAKGQWPVARKLALAPAVLPDSAEGVELEHLGRRDVL
jgi:hypothetical protein